VPIDFSVDEDLAVLRSRTRAFINDVVIPFEADDGALGSHGPSPDLRSRLQAAAREAGLFAPTAPVTYGGLGLDHRGQAVVLEESGRSLLGPLAMNCAAPDEGNIFLLEHIGNSAQKARYLAPLAAGAVRSCFAMTEPSPGAGSDPARLTTCADRVAEGWRIEGRKWFITGADGADFAIVMARTDQDRATMFLVDLSSPGLTVERRIGTLDTGFSGGHCEISLKDCVVPEDAVLGTVGNGFQGAQIRLAPARLTHCMRWLGAARRAHEEAVRYAAGRPMFDTRLAGLGMAQAMIADNEIDISASRALIWHAAWTLDAGRAGREETSVTKTFVAEAVCRVMDRSMQLCGAYGVSGDGPVARLFTEARPFRIYDGPSEVHRRAIARRAVRRSESGALPGAWA
jgi:acyl-CoA dehydrogenase